MTELDAFETRFAAAYRAYLDEVPTRADAAEIARAVVAGRRSRWRVGAWRLGSLPMAARLALLAILLLAATVVGAVVGGARHPRTTETLGDLPAGMAGTWAATSTDPGVTITLAGCAVDEVCGSLTVVNPRATGSDWETCEYPLTLRAPEGDVAVFESGIGGAFRCGWSAWDSFRWNVTVLDPDTIELVRQGGGPVSYRLYPVDAP